MCAIFTAYHKFRYTVMRLSHSYNNTSFLVSSVENLCIGSSASSILFVQKEPTMQCIYFCLFSSKVIYLSVMVSYISIMSACLISR